MSAGTVGIGNRLVERSLELRLDLRLVPSNDMAGVFVTGRGARVLNHGYHGLGVVFGGSGGVGVGECSDRASAFEL